MRPFIEINDRYVKVGRLFSINSSPSPAFEVLRCCLCRWWGGWGFIPNDPTPGISLAILEPEVTPEL
jgi:hypothetical protein